MKAKIDFNINNLVRDNIKKLKPYQSAREELKNDNSIFLDANENPFPSGYNRYPDPLQRELKTEIGKQKGIAVDNIFLGNGSDEIIDLLIRAFCEPQRDSILINVPTYGMYEVCAAINNVDLKKIELNSNFQLDINKIFDCLHDIKMMIVCSPNNPTGNSFNKKDIITILQNFNGVFVIDEAYIEFSEEKSFLDELLNFPNLVILQTFSKARAMAGIRVGMGFADAEIIHILNKIKSPYNISLLNQKAALKALKTSNINLSKQAILRQKEVLINELQQLGLVLKIWPSDANFLLVEFINYKEVFYFLNKKNIIVRDRSNEPNCSCCLRITVGTSNENSMLIRSLRELEKLTLKNYEKDIIS
ncbi:MAG: histidinol-phosphate transaminase [Marinilabiliales bacterium]|nr:MAG: histidinol-phosphate transaminase [Marinilabiliales bacterium]